MDEIVTRVVERSQAVATEKPPRRFVYTKVSTMEELDANGDVKSTKEKTYEVTQIGGLPRNRLIKVDGKAVSDRQRQREEQEARERRDAAEEKDKATRDDKAKARNPFMITREVADRYDFTLRKRTMLEGRAVYVVDFQPRRRPSASTKLVDRVLDKISGTLWVDEADSEIARAKLGLTERVTFLGGVLGSLERFDLTLTRRRAFEGVWYNHSTLLVFEGRKVFDAMRFRTREESADFRQVAEAR